MPVYRTIAFIKPLIKQTALILLVVCLNGIAAADTDTKINTPSKRIEVYGLAQNFWEVRPGDSLSGITQQLLPNNPALRVALQTKIMQLNPTAFIDGKPSLLIAGKRLRLPVYMNKADSKVDMKTTTVESYSWGNIKRQKE